MTVTKQEQCWKHRYLYDIPWFLNIDKSFNDDDDDTVGMNPGCTLREGHGCQLDTSATGG